MFFYLRQLWQRLNTWLNRKSAKRSSINRLIAYLNDQTMQYDYAGDTAGNGIGDTRDHITAIEDAISQLNKLEPNWRNLGLYESGYTDFSKW